MNIFVAKLNFQTQEDDLRELFEEFGTVDSVKIIMDRATGKSKGFGFVEMPDENEALVAIHDLNDNEFDERVIAVKKAKPRENSGGFSRGRGGYNSGGGRDNYNRNRY